MSTEGKKRSFWQILRKMLGSRSELHFADGKAAISQLPESSWQQVTYDENSAERQQTDQKR